MRQWTVEGADRETGQPRSVKVLAGDEGEAEKMANARGLLVARVFIYKPPKIQKPRRTTGASETQDAGRRLRTADFVLRNIGCVYLGFAVLGALEFVLAIVKVRELAPEAIYALVLTMVCVGAAILFFGAGAALKMLAIIGERGERPDRTDAK